MSKLDNNMMNDDELENVTGGKGPLDRLISTVAGYEIGTAVYYCGNGSRQLAQIIGIEHNNPFDTMYILQLYDSPLKISASGKELYPI